MQITIEIIGAKVNGKTLVHRSQLCKLLGLKPSSFRVKLTQDETLKKAKVNTAMGEMFHLERILTLK